MDSQHWLDRWEQHQIGFHQNEINQHLKQFWPELQIPIGTRVFVPLCGKTRDMLWLREQGYDVVAIELSPIAVQDFFSENDLTSVQRSEGGFSVCEIPGIRIFCGDFFDLEPHQLEGVGVVYDRASLIALPPEMRRRYVEKLSQLFPTAINTLLITMDYPQQEMSGPPFSVTMEEVQVLYAGRYEIEQIFELDILADSPRFKARGLTHLAEKVYRLHPLAGS